MDNSKKYDNPSPQTKANPISRLFFWWLMPFIIRGSKYDLKMRDVYNIQKSEMSDKLTDKFERNWRKLCEEAKQKNEKPSLKTAISRTFFNFYAFIIVIDVVKFGFLSYAMPTALDALINYFNDNPRDPEKGWILCGIVMAIILSHNFTNHHSLLQKKIVGMRIRIACGSLIYRKVLRLNKASLGETDVGKVVNLLANDLQRFDIAAEVYSSIFVMPFVTIIGTYVMYTKVGYIAFIAVGTMLVQAVPFQGYLSKLLGKYRLEIAGKTDIRVKLMNEIITGIQVIKMYAWEKPFEELVDWLRIKEIDTIIQTSYIKSIMTATQVFTERFTLYVVIIFYVFLGHSLNGGMVFSLSQLINTLQLIICILFPMALSSYAEAKASISRLEDFLLKEERIERKLEKCEPGLIKLESVYAFWNPDSGLFDISFELPPGNLCCIVGSVGSGKSSILSLLLDELGVKSGNMEIGGKISYASQEPWLFVSNVRNNILFGQPFEKEKYDKVIKACALERDFELFPFGDKTLVGEKGVSLSGGQRARINLARAVYRDADIYLFDDPLSAVDPHVAKHLMHECINGYLKEKTRILVTHQTQFLDKADYVLALENGKVENFFKPTEISTNEIKVIRKISAVEPLIAPKASQEIFHSLASLKSIESMENMETKDEEPTEEQELIEKGAMNLNVYKEYYKSGANNAFIIFEIFLFIIAQTLCNACDLLVAYWTNADTAKTTTTESYNFTTETTKSYNFTTEITESTNFEITESSNIFSEFFANIPEERLTQYFYMLIYTVFIGSAVALTILRSAIFYKICMNASKSLHTMIFSNVLQAKMRFFDTNPSGRILNRFSKDVGAMDELLPLFSLVAIQQILVGSGIMMMIFIKSYVMIIPAFLFAFLIQKFRKIFSKAAQDLKRLEGTAKAPVFSYIAASLDGLPTIRCSNAEDMVKKEFDILQDEHTSTFYLFIYAFEAFSFYLDLISNTFYFVIVANFLLNPYSLSGDVGLILSQSLIIVNMIQFATKNVTDVINNMTSVERVLQYTKLDKEGPYQTPNYPPENWPESGRITFKNVYLRYVQDEDPVLKNLNLEIEPGEKIGIVGRTGAGKSTLISALFRLAPMDGTIQIDGVDTEKVGLRDLRSRISIIPQEPTLFSESIRFNLDPLGRAGDPDLWKALDAVELKNTITRLDTMVTEGGANFSVGQKQLICLARAIVRNNKVLVMDEATANVDQQTDALIQKTIRENFKNCTVLTVAHRLNTIIDSDKVIVMDAGEMKEFGAPHELLQNSNGFFNIMVEKTGPVMEKKLRQIAETHYESKFSKKST